MKYLTLEGLSYFHQKITGLINQKVSKETGKGLSTNDYTTTEKNKLSGLSNFTHPTTAGNKHIPAGGAAGQILLYGGSSGVASWGANPGAANVIETVKLNGTALTVTSKAVDIDLSGYATKADINTVYKVKGTKANMGALPTTGNVSGDVWNVDGDGKGANYVWTGTAWDKLSETIDLSPYMKAADIEIISNSEIDTLMA